MRRVLYMKCPLCGADTRTIETRDTRRRRECFNEHRFTTTELVIRIDTVKMPRGRPKGARTEFQKIEPS